MLRHCLLPLLLLAAAIPGQAHAETGAQAWLRYAPPPDPPRYRDMPHEIVRLGHAPEERAAAEELETGLGRMIAGAPETLPAFHRDIDAIVLGTADELRRSESLQRHLHGYQPAQLAPDAFRITHVRNRARQCWVIQGGSPRGVLYGAFRLLEWIAQDRQLPTDTTETPASTIRWVDEWDNLDGTVERGYAGPSIFFDRGHVRPDLSRVRDYARLLSSVGINGITVNNVNSDLRTLRPEMLDEFARIADTLRPWGVRMALSVDLSSPQVVGGLSTFDPLDPRVIAWWQAKVDEIYKLIPDFAGFTVKADSEGRPGPHGYGRSPLDAANALAKPLQAHGGVVLYRGFVYNNHLDFHDLKADRARAGYDNFRAYDGKFLPNVIIQIKHGPIDFQVREPVSPLIAALRHTPQAMELQITQEYLGQQRHMVYIAPMWKWVLDTDMRVDNRPSPVREIVTGRTFHQPQGGMVGVANVGMDTNWLHHPMALANLYSFGRLAWNPTLTPEVILDEWARMTWSNDGRVYEPIEQMNLASWHAYEQYTGPLGAGTLTDILGTHFGPGPESADNNGWGQWIRAAPGPTGGIGMDRTVATGTGYIGQYPPELASKYESLATCPDDLLLFMHHVPWTYHLRGDDPDDKTANGSETANGSKSANGSKTVIQHIYDAHYAGAATTQSFVDQWESVKGLVDDERYEQVHALLVFQTHHAEVWRDAINDWFARESGIPDALGFVGHHADREEAEALPGTGFHTVDVSSWETASGGKAAVCNTAPCELHTTFHGAANPYRIEVGYFDRHPGTAQYRLLVNGTEVATWAASDTLPPDRPDPRLNGHTATRFVANGIRLKPGDIVDLQATPDDKDTPAVDFLEITRDPRWN
ncbi:alpha-glucuronidase family glycosyl hydrolase [Terriglobus sp.]|uniref:alpha-glucuronidase family glycosyl hydrolase n=1 Tax=Terriglobus sp. TaxID=1889013 RepID=UPI003B004257